jgi:hypothetical protein
MLSYSWASTSLARAWHGIFLDLVYNDVWIRSMRNDMYHILVHLSVVDQMYVANGCVIILKYLPPSVCVGEAIVFNGYRFLQSRDVFTQL